MRRILLFLAPLIVLGGLVALFALNINRDPDYIPSVLINRPAPATDLPAIDGSSKPGFSSADFGADVTVVNVFASWCIPCRDEHPLLMQLAQTGLPIFGLNQKDAPENALSFLNELGNPYTRIGADRDGRASIDWGVYGVPETFVVSSQGIIVYKHTGPLTEKSLAEGLLPAISSAD